MNEELGEQIAIGYWTHDEKKVLEWIQILTERHTKFTMTAYNEAYHGGSIMYSFRLEPVPELKMRDALERLGFEHSYFIYKGK